mmetsp:Transcript_151592/g.264153  ORF Transcript_151592/g.264153 Transcript_151592/m.264153 type:complete len:843 (-) Transcript_151592:78-2606(-)
MVLQLLKRMLLRWPLILILGVAKLCWLSYWMLRAYRIRLHAVTTFGLIIHEFDPWFNYRATEYLAEHGWQKFFKWYDYMSWYPIGRPVGTTIYPGMQFTAVAIWKVMSYLPEYKYKIPKDFLSRFPKWLPGYLPNKGRVLSIGPMSLNDVCVMSPAWFGASATFFTFMLTSELSGSTTAGCISAFVMSIIPAHIMRSVAGGFDNEAIAVTAFTMTLWLWCRCVRNARSWWIGIFAGLAYAYAAAVWGGYIFINNLIALHALFLVGLGKYNYGTYRAFTLYYVIGTFGAMRVPVIGWAPFRSVEQLPSLLVFVGYQIIEFCDVIRRNRKSPITPWRFFFFRISVWVFVALLAAGGSYVLYSMGFFMPLGARIRGLFLEAVKTGNPLVDSVAEHQPANDQAYDMYLNKARFIAVAGLLFCWHQKSPGKFLAPLYAAVAYHYSLKMSRLVLICGPIVSVLAGFPAGIIMEWCFEQFCGFLCKPRPDADDVPLEPRTGGMCSIWRTLWRFFKPFADVGEFRDLSVTKEAFSSRFWFIDRPVRLGIAWVILVAIYNQSKSPAKDFIKHCDRLAEHMSSPSIMLQTTLRNGESVIIRDYYDGYLWVKKHTPADSRVIAWWDYGYQITGIANRTSIADGNTWNHEHIATLGRILTSNERRSHKAMRHIADYALVWGGGSGDDLAKSPHLARIGNSVFPDHCGDDDPLCNKFSFYRDGTPTPMMAESFLFKAVKHGMEGITLNPKLWKEVHTTKYGLMRVFKVLNVSKESKEWIADPANRVCDAPGSWYCVGQYPPALMPLINKRRNFAQLEDFNKGKGEKSAYTKLIEKQRAEGGGKKGRKETPALEEL